MPFQAIPIALKENTGDPTSKLLWIYLVHHADIDDAPNGMGWLQIETADAARFCQCSEEDLERAMLHLERLRLVTACHWKGWSETSLKDEAGVDVNLPMSDLRQEERRRIKASPDQVSYLASAQRFQCATCGEYHGSDVAKWHVDHIIPRSRGGADVGGNLQVICSTCNLRKGAKVHFVDFLGGRR